MFINCPHCRTLVATDPVSDAPPERCPRCKGALRGTKPSPAPSVATLLRTPLPAAAAADGTQDHGATRPLPAPGTDVRTVPHAATQREAGPATPDGSQVRAEGPNVSPAAESAPSGPQASTAPATPATPPSAARRRAAVSPSFARRMRAAGTAGSPRQRRLLLVATGALSLLLVLQLLLADRARLAGDPGWRPLLTALCGVLRCDLPAWREPAALTVLARDVRPDPDTPAQLLVSATFRNDARWAQGWPHLRLTLSDVDGRAVGARIFAPDEYLGGAARPDALAPGHSADVRLLLREPDGRAVSFAFDFI